MALIIGGHPRSGTTMLNRLCQNHPEIMMTGEFRNFLRLDVPFLRYAQSIRKDWYRRGIISHSGRRAPLKARVASARFLAVYLMRLALCGSRTIGLEQIETVLHQMFPEAQIVGDKYPRYIFDIDNLAMVSGLKRVIIYRDGRDVVSSFLRMARTIWKGDRFIRERQPTARKVGHAWVKSIRLMEEHSSDLHIIQYEALVTDPSKYLLELSNYLGVSSKGFRAHLLRKTAIGRYREGLNQAELEDLMDVAGTTLEQLGYV